MKKQVVVIHGGDTFDTHEEYLEFLRDYMVDLDKLRGKRWGVSLQDDLGDDFDVILIKMPCKDNAKYSEWKLWFEKYIPLFNDEVILVGHSLGGIFLAKYLSENKFPKKLRGAFLVSAPYDDETQDSLGDFRLERSLEQLKNQVTDIYLYHSKDDDVVRFADFESYKKELPNAHAEAFEDRGHINQEKFPELIRDIKKVFA